MNAEHPSMLEALRLIPFLAQVPTEDLAPLSARAHRVTCVAREVLFRQGDPAEAFFIVISGHIILYLDGDDDPSHIARICGPRESFGEWCVCSKQACPVTAHAFGPTELITIPGDALAALFTASPDLACALIAEITVRLRGLVRQMMDLKMKTAAQRVGGYLLELAHGREEPCEIRLPFEKKLLAHDLGMQPETLSRILLKLQGVGVRYHRSIDAFLIADVAALRQFCDEAGPHPAPLADHAAEC